MSAEYLPNLSFVRQIPAEFLKLREYSANPDISWIFLSASRNLKINSAEGSATNYKQVQSYLTKGGIAESSFVFARWQHETDRLAALHVLAGGSTPKSPLPVGVRDPHLTQCVIEPYKCTW